MAALRTLRRSLLDASWSLRRPATTAAAATQAAVTASFAAEPGLPPSSAPAPYTSQWKTTEDVPLTRESFLDLLHGRTPLIRQPGFVSRDVCWTHEQILSPQLAPYKHNTGPPLAKVGVAQFEYQAQSADDFQSRAESARRSPFRLLPFLTFPPSGPLPPLEENYPALACSRRIPLFAAEYDEYFRDAAKWHSLHGDLAAQTGVNLWQKVIDRIRSLMPDWDVELASQGPGRVYFSGIFRALNHSTYLHCDWSPYDSATEAWVVNQVEAQAVFNLYLAPVAPGDGGETVVHDVQWTEAALREREPAHYGYRPALVAGRRRAVVRPEPGALCFFNSRNIHQVISVTPTPMPELGLAYRPRLTLSSFLGLLPASKTGGRPKLILWS